MTPGSFGTSPGSPSVVILVMVVVIVVLVVAPLPVTVVLLVMPLLVLIGLVPVGLTQANRLTRAAPTDAVKSQ